MRSSVINLGEAREAEPQDTTNLVGKSDSRFVDNTWLNKSQLVG